MSFSNTHQQKLLTKSSENELQNKIENALHDMSSLAGQKGVNVMEGVLKSLVRTDKSTKTHLGRALGVNEMVGRVTRSSSAKYEKDQEIQELVQRAARRWCEQRYHKLRTVHVKRLVSTRTLITTSESRGR